MIISLSRRIRYITNNLQIFYVRKVNTEWYFTSFNWKKMLFWSCIFLAYMQRINWHLSQHLLNIHRRRFLFQVPSNLKLIFIKPDTCFEKCERLIGIYVALDMLLLGWLSFILMNFHAYHIAYLYIKSDDMTMILHVFLEYNL